MSDYQPKPGTYAAKAIAWLRLQPEGTAVTSAVLREAVGMAPTNRIYHALGDVIAAGLIRRHGAGSGTLLLWSLPEVTEVDLGAERDDEWPRRTLAPEIQPRLGPFLPGVSVGAGARWITPVSLA